MSIRRPRVAAAALAATVLASTVSPLLPTAPAQAAPTGGVSAGSATWGLSRYLNSPNPGRPNPLASAYAAPSTFTAATQLSTWGAGTGLVAPDGSADLAFSGTTVNFAPTGGGWLRLSDLQADLDASGNGTVSAVVAYGTSVTGNPGNLTYDPAQAPDRGPARVDLVTLAGNTAADRAATPTAATWTGLDGTWDADLLAFLAGAPATEASPAVPAWSYAPTVTNNVTNPANGTAYNPTRTPEPFTFAVDTVVPATTATITRATPGNGVSVAVEGTGFRAVTNPGDAGVYVGIAPAGGLPDVSDPAGIDAFAAAAYVTPGQVVDGAFSRSLTAATADLDPSETYAVYTWQAHAHSNTTQDTETPLAIDFADLVAQETTTTVAAPARQTYGTTSTLTATVGAPGAVTLTGLGAARTVETVDGVATFTVPARLGVGTHTATLAYAGDGDHLPSQATHELTVTAARPTAALDVTTRPVTGPPARTGRAAVVVTGPTTVAAPTGTVTLRVTRPGGLTRVATATLRWGRVSVVVPTVGKGRWTVTATYAGSDSFAPATRARSIVVG